MLKEAHDTLVRGVITGIFDYEDDFKDKLLKQIGWNKDSYEIERCHLATNFRLTVVHDYGREKDVYIPSTEVYDWVLELQTKLGE